MTEQKKAAKNRIAAALQAGRAHGEQSLRERGSDVPPPPVGGNWTKSAVTSLTERLDEMREMALQGILEGTLPIRLRVDQIDDLVGSDRVTQADEQDDNTEGFRALVDNIRRRGLRVPLRVRPADTSWRPNPKNPSLTGDERFILQSGRRRLAACRELGIDPIVFLSFVEEEDARLDDLQERFFENTVRRNLTSYEKILSIGVISGEFPEMTQDQIAEIIGVPRSWVSRGIAVLRFREELDELIDPATATVAEIDAALARLRKDNRSDNPDAVRKRVERERNRDMENAPALPFRKRSFRGTTVSLRANRDGGRTMTVRTSSLDGEALERIAALVEELDGASIAGE